MGIDSNSYWNVAYLWGFGILRVLNCRHACKLTNTVDRICWKNCWNSYCYGACTDKLVYCRWDSRVGLYVPAAYRG